VFFSWKSLQYAQAQTAELPAAITKMDPAAFDAHEFIAHLS
jgi:hypothetical protein